MRQVVLVIRAGIQVPERNPSPAASLRVAAVIDDVVQLDELLCDLGC